MKLPIATVIFAASLLHGCSNTPEEEFREQQALTMEAKQHQVSETLSNTPDWYLNPHRADQQGIYSVSTAYAEDMQAAVDKAMLLGEYNLAKSYSQAISGQERLLREQSGDGAVSESNEVIIDKFVDQVVIKGHRVIDKKISAERQGYRVFVLLQLPYSTENTYLRKNLHEAHKELLDRVNDRQSPKLSSASLDSTNKDDREKAL